MNEIKATPILTRAIEDPAYRDFLLDLYGEGEFAALELVPFRSGALQSDFIVITNGFIIFANTPDVRLTNFF